MPVGVDWTIVSDDFSVSSPDMENGLFCADTGSSWVAARAKPVVLWSSGSSGSDTGVGGSVDCLPEDVVQEERVVGDYSCS